MHAPFLRRYLCKSVLYSEGVCPFVLEEQDSEINKLKTPTKHRALGCHEESEGEPRCCTSPGVSALLSKASPHPPHPSPTLLMLTSLFPFPPPLLLWALSLSTQSCCVHPHCSLTNSRGQTTFHTQSRERPLPGWHPDLIIDYLFPWVLFPESLIWGNRGDKRLAGALEAKWLTLDQQQMAGCWAKATDTS